MWMGNGKLYPLAQVTSGYLRNCLHRESNVCRQIVTFRHSCLLQSAFHYDFFVVIISGILNYSRLDNKVAMIKLSVWDPSGDHDPILSVSETDRAG